MPQLFRKKAAMSGPSDDDIREQRLSEVKQLAERFTYDLGLIIAGHKVKLEDYVASEAADRVRKSLEPFLSSGDLMRPNFGEYGELRVEGNLLNLQQPIFAYIEFDDQSVRETKDGDLIPMGKRRMLLTLVIDPSCTGVNDFTLRPADSS
jgi:hypothetical protein